MHCKTSELRNSLERPRKFPEIFGNSWIIFRNCDTLQNRNLTPLGQKKLAGILYHCQTIRDTKRATEVNSDVGDVGVRSLIIGKNNSDTQ